MGARTYVENFDRGPGGWFGWASNIEGPKRLEYTPGVVVSRSPWWIDYNHAPPGAGYLHILFCLLTKGPGYGEAYMEAGGINRFIEQSFPTDFTNARITLRVKGELKTRGSQLVLLIQTSGDGLTSGWALTASPFVASEDWAEQTIVAAPDQNQWTCLGARKGRSDFYGQIALSRALQNVNANIMLILFPLEVVPMGPIAGDPHLLRAGRDYPVWTSYLPEGYVMLDEVRIAFP